MASSDKKMSTNPHGHHGAGKLPPKSPFSPPASDDDDDMDYGDDSESDGGTDDDEEMEDEKNEASKSNSDRQIPVYTDEDSIEIPYLKLCEVYKEACDKIQTEKEKNATLKSKNATLQSRIAKLNTEASRDLELYKESMANANSENEILEDTITEVESELEEVKAALKKNVPNAQIYLDEISAKDATIEKCNQENANYLDQVGKLQEKVTTLETTNQEQRATIVNKDETVSWLRKENDGMKDELTKGQSKWNTSLRVKDAELAKKIVEISEKQLDNDLYKRQAIQTLRARDKTIEESKAREQAKDQQIIQLQAQLSVASSQSEPLNVDVIKAVQERNEAIAKYQAKEQALGQEMSELRANAEKRFKDVIAHAEAEVAKRNTQIEEYKGKEGVKDREIQTERIRATDKFHKLDNEHKAVRAQLDSANAAMETKVQEITKLKAELSKASEPDTTLKAQLDEAIRAHVRQIEGQKNELINASKTVEDLCGKMAAKDQEIWQLKADRSGTSSDEFNALKAGAEEEIEVRNRTIEDQKKDLAHARTAIEELRGKVNAKDQEIVQLKAERSSVSPDEYEAWKTQMEEAIQERDRTIEELKKESTNQGIAIDEHRGREQAKDREIVQLKAERSSVSPNEYEAWKTQMEEAIQARDRTIEELKKELANQGIAVDEHRGREQAKDQEIVRLTDASNALKDAKDQEIAQLAKERDDASEQVSFLRTTIEEAAQHRDQKIKEQNEETTTEKPIHDRDQKIKEQNQEITKMGDTIDGLRLTVEAKVDEISKLNQRIHKAEGESKVSASAKNELENHIGDQTQTIEKRDQTIRDLHKTVRDLKDQIKVHEIEKQEISRTLNGNQSENVGDLAKSIKREKASHAKKLLEVRKEFNKERMNYNEVVEKEFAGLEEAMAGLQKDVDSLERLVLELRQTSKDLQDEVEAATRKNNGTQRDAVTKIAEAGAKPPTMTDAATQVEAGEEKRPDNELRQFSPPLPTLRTVKGRPDMVWFVSSESEEEPPRPQPRFRRRRRKSSSPVALIRTSKASTQTDDQPKASQASAQPTMVVKSETSDMGTQTDGERKRVTVNRGTQTVPIHPPPSITGAATSPQTSAWQHVPWWLLLLVLAVLLAAALSGLSAHRERTMWLAANDCARRAVISVRVGGGTGTKVPAWLWREPLVNLTNRYF
ncbi:MAG: hypothetical protein Q9188_001214 [Gyalolechia gomerana]